MTDPTGSTNTGILYTKLLHKGTEYKVGDGVYLKPPSVDTKSILKEGKRLLEKRKREVVTF